MKIPKILVVAVIGICGVALTVLVVMHNKTYASKVFANKVAYDKVLASCGHHWQILGCTYAIVSLKEGASHSPPVSWLGNESWLKTPVRITRPTHHDDTTNPILICVEDDKFSADVADRLRIAVRDPGSYYIHLGENLFLYSEPQKLAAVVRYGD
jgi:hypothetical protein